MVFKISFEDHLVDFPHPQSQNEHMHRSLYQGILSGLGALLLAVLPGLSATETGAVETKALTTLFWCPLKPGNELQVKPDPGCDPLVEEEKKPDEKKPIKKREVTPVKPENVEVTVSMFLKDYRNFLACCAQDPDFDQLEELEARASALIKETMKNMSVASIYMSRNQALIVPVARARDDLRELKRRIGQLSDAKDRLEELNYERAGRERRKIQDAEDSLGREFVPRRGPSRAATGAEIGGTGPTGPEVGAAAPTGTTIGQSAPTGTGIGIQPPTLGELVDTPPGIERNRDNTLTLTNPVTTGTVGPSIGVTPPTGPEIGNSSSNR